MDEYNRKANLHYEMIDCSQIMKCIQMERKEALPPWDVEFLKIVHHKHYASILELMPANEWSFEEFWEEFKVCKHKANPRGKVKNRDFSCIGK